VKGYEVYTDIHKLKNRGYGGGVPAFLRNCHIEEVQTAYHCPWQNPYCERAIGILRRELFDYIIPLNERHLHRLSRNTSAIRCVLTAVWTTGHRLWIHWLKSRSFHRMIHWNRNRFLVDFTCTPQNPQTSIITGLCIKYMQKLVLHRDSIRTQNTVPRCLGYHLFDSMLLC
jgi:hypothetical protein